MLSPVVLLLAAGAGLVAGNNYTVLSYVPGTSHCTGQYVVSNTDTLDTCKVYRLPGLPENVCQRHWMPRGT